MSATGLKQNQNDIGYFVTLANMAGKVYAYAPTSAAVFSKIGRAHV